MLDLHLFYCSIILNDAVFFWLGIMTQIFISYIVQLQAVAVAASVFDARTCSTVAERNFVSIFAFALSLTWPSSAQMLARMF